MSKKTSAQIWREGQLKAGVKECESKSQWEIDVQEFDEEIELINKKDSYSWYYLFIKFLCYFLHFYKAVSLIYVKNVLDLKDV